MSFLQDMSVIWGAILVAFIAVMIYRGHLSLHETEQLFLSENANEANLVKQTKVSRRASRVDPLFHSLGGVAVLLTVAMASTYLVQQIPHMRV
jgi:hypothetical protein